jgi:hypothetical protein
MTTEEAREALIDALKLKRERTVGELDSKLARRRQLDEAIDMMMSGGVSPSADHLCKLLDDPDERRVRAVITAWTGHSGNDHG